MTSEQTDLAKRAVACKAWRWMPGMLVWRERRRHPPVLARFSSFQDEYPEFIDPKSISAKSLDGGTLFPVVNGKRMGLADSLNLTPDLNDPATLGCLLALVREAWGDPYLCCVGDRETGWRLDGYAAVEDIHSYRSEAEALVRALEAAP
jgi:hypothetical protein